MRSKYEKQAEKELQNEGNETDYKVRPFRVPRGYRIDYFGLFDLMAWNPASGELRLIAIKGHKGVPSVLRKGIESFKVTRVVREIWTYKADGKVKVESLSG